MQFWKISFSINSVFWSAFVCVHATPMKMKLCKLISSFNQCMWFYWPELKKVDSRDLSILNLENCIKCQKWHHLIRIFQSNQTRNFRRYCHPLKKFTFGQFFRQPKSLSENFWDRNERNFWKIQKHSLQRHSWDQDNNNAPSEKNQKHRSTYKLMHIFALDFCPGKRGQ